MPKKGHTGPRHFNCLWLRVSGSGRKQQRDQSSWPSCAGQDITDYVRTAQRYYQSCREAIHSRGKGLVRPREPCLLKRLLPSPNLAVHFSNYCRRTTLSSRPLSSPEAHQIAESVLSERVGVFVMAVANACANREERQCNDSGNYLGRHGYFLLVSEARRSCRLDRPRR